MPITLNTLTKVALTTLFLFGLTHEGRAQQQAQYTQYMYNTAVYNPAYVGSRERPTVTALHRSQWTGLDGAPVTQNLNITAPLSERVGVGLSFINDKIGNGTSQETYIDALFAYTVPVSYEGRLAFGLMARGHFLSVDSGQLRHYDSSISPEEVHIDHKFSPNFGMGVYFYQWNGYLGLSVPNLLETQHFNTSGNQEAYVLQERMHFNLIAGYVWEANPRLKIKPAVLLEAVQGSPLQANLSANFLFNDRFRLGAAYRWDTAWSALVGLDVSTHFLIGLAYDRETTALGSTAFNDGSFEVFLRYTFGGQKGKIRSPRFF